MAGTTTRDSREYPKKEQAKLKNKLKKKKKKRDKSVSCVTKRSVLGKQLSCHFFFKKKKVSNKK
jgi:hypothetical protein